jgi:hypothetical protein
MSLFVSRPAQSSKLAAFLRVHFPGVRDPEDAQSMTFSGLSDLPPIHPGTVDWHLQDKYIYISEQHDYSDYESVPTGTSVITARVSMRVPELFEFHIIDDEMNRLEKIAANGDERAFVQAAKQVNWASRTPEDYLRGIQYAFRAGAHIYARQLAANGAVRYPEHQELQKYANILAPPTVVKAELPSGASLSKNRDWLQNYRAMYRGQWVALKDGELVGVASTLQDLRDQIGRTKEVLLTKVP